MLINTGAGTHIFNQNGSSLINTAVSYTSYGGFTDFTQGGAVTNEQGATLTNTGVGTTLTNEEGAFLENTGVGTTLINENGATLNNTATEYEIFSPALSQAGDIYNHAGAAIINTGAGTRT